MKKFVSYYRVSTKRQGRSGLGLDAQREAVTAYLATVQGQLVDAFTEVEHGTRKGNNRPELQAVLAACRVHGATLVIAKLDRLSRNVFFVSSLMESNVEFTACDFPQANRLTIHVLAAVAEPEAGNGSARTKVALAVAKRRGVVLGGDRGSLQAVCRKGARASARVRSERAQRRAADLAPIVEQIKAAGATSLRQIAAGFNQRGIPASRGGSHRHRATIGNRQDHLSAFRTVLARAGSDPVMPGTPRH